jgi:hypothetical protein
LKVRWTLCDIPFVNVTLDKFDRNVTDKNVYCIATFILNV